MKRKPNCHSGLLSCIIRFLQLCLTDFYLIQGFCIWAIVHLLRLWLFLFAVSPLFIPPQQHSRAADHCCAKQGPQSRHLHPRVTIPVRQCIAPAVTIKYLSVVSQYSHAIGSKVMIDTSQAARPKPLSSNHESPSNHRR